MKHSIATVTLPGILEQKIKAIAKAGYDGFEIFENDFTVSNLSPENVKKLAEDLGLEIAALQPFRDFEGMPAHIHQKNMERAKLKLELMQRLNVSRLFVCSNCSIHAIDDKILAYEQLNELANLATSYHISVSYEALSWGKYVNLSSQSSEIVQLVNHPNLYNLLDSYHFCIKKESLEVLNNIPIDKISFVQVADAQYYDMTPMQIGRHLRCFPGQGTLPVNEFVETLKNRGYDGYLSHEIFSDDFRGANIEDISLNGKRSLIWLDFKDKSHENIQLDSLKLPIKNKKAWISLFENLGFAIDAKQINCESGLIKIILDETIENSVIGLISKDAQGIQERANLLKYSMNGNELQSYGKVNFQIKILNKKQNKSNSIISIDHIGHVVKPEDFGSATLFYKSVFNLEIEDALDILDPNGIVQSRVLRKNDLRIVLSTSKNKDNLFTGIQQIAIACDDIFSVANQLKNRNQVLEIPENYYNNLKTKGILTNKEIDQLKQWNILFDISENHYFYHFYFQEIDGVFIEIVQRCGNYDRYGEMNAQLRLAAQARSQNNPNLN